MPKKIILSSNQLVQIKQLFDQELGSRKIAETLGISRWLVQQGYKELDIYDIGRKTPRIVPKQTEKVCKICKSIKSVNNFRKRVRKNDGRVSYECYCFDCEYEINLKRLKTRAKRLRQNDPNFVIRCSVSYFIWKSLKNNGATKNGESCLSYLGYSIDELKFHLESQFDPWMTWDNHGNYNKKAWDDNDPTTWTWQIDHIIPQTSLPYVSMTDDNFKKCWALSNLRPLNAKQNNSDGANKIRHIAA